MCKTTPGRINDTRSLETKCATTGTMNYRSSREVREFLQKVKSRKDIRPRLIVWRPWLIQIPFGTGLTRGLVFRVSVLLGRPESIGEGGRRHNFDFRRRRLVLLVESASGQVFAHFEGIVRQDPSAGRRVRAKVPPVMRDAPSSRSIHGAWRRREGDREKGRWRVGEI